MRQPQEMQDLSDELQRAVTSGDLETVDRLAAELDAMEHRAPVKLGTSAMWYAKQGLHIFPLSPGLKIPYRNTHGFEDATTDLSRISTWWTANPTSNIGIATGHLVDVIDIDGPVGIKSWLASSIPKPERVVPDQPEIDHEFVTEADGEEEATHCRKCGVAWGEHPKIETEPDPEWDGIIGTVSTPRPAGIHLYVPVTGTGNGAKLAPSIDYRGLGGYVVAPPSQNVEIVRDGEVKQYAGQYHWRKVPDFSRLVS